MDKKELMKTEEIRIKKKSRSQEIWRRFKKNKLALFGMVLFIIILLVTILADVIVSYDMAVTQVCLLYTSGADKGDGVRGELPVAFFSRRLGGSLSAVSGCVSTGCSAGGDGKCKRTCSEKC